MKESKYMKIKLARHNNESMLDTPRPKHTVISLAVLAMTFSLLIACGEQSEKVISGDVQSNQQGTDTESSQATNDNQKQSDDGDAITTYVFKSGDTTISIGAEAATIIDALGEPMSKYESASCAFGDLDVTYTYSGFEVDTYQENGVDYISNVILLDDSVSTPEGIYIGSSQADVEAAYGTPNQEVNGNYVYEGDAVNFEVLFENGQVSSIQYLNTILD